MSYSPNMMYPGALLTDLLLRMRIVFLLGLLTFMTSAFPMASKVRVENAIDNAIMRYGLRTEPELRHLFNHAHVAYPPKEMALLAFKEERKIELWAKTDGIPWRFIHSFPLTAYSGHLGPKLKERDGQIPEGIYHLVTFNPLSSMHLSMMIDYPNQFDRLQALKDGRKQLGNNIFLHGKSISVGCLAVGDHAIDELFLLSRRVGLSHIKVIIAPNDLRIKKPDTPKFAQPRWLPELYRQVADALKRFPVHHLT